MDRADAVGVGGSGVGGSGVGGSGVGRSGAGRLPRAPFDLRLVGVLGRGATAVVYLAEEPATGRRFAAKLLTIAVDAAGTDDQARARFREEAAKLGHVRHPNVVGVFGYAEVSGACWLVTEHVAGASLRQLLHARAPLAQQDAVAVVAGAVSGLDAVHRAGLVHGDVKPENVLVRSDGVSKLADFGLASRPGSPAVGWSPGYQSPEVLAGAPLDAASDLYAMGVILHEALTGRRPRLPLVAVGRVDQLGQVAQAGPSGLSGQGLPRPMAAFLGRTLHPEPAARPRSAEQLADELAAAADASYGWERRRKVAAAAVGAVVGAGTLDVLRAERAGAAGNASGAGAAGATAAAHATGAASPRGPARPRSLGAGRLVARKALISAGACAIGVAGLIGIVANQAGDHHVAQPPPAAVRQAVDHSTTAHPAAAARSVRAARVASLRRDHAVDRHAVDHHAPGNSATSTPYSRSDWRIGNQSVIRNPESESCASAHFCMLTDQSSNVIEWNGRTFLVQHLPGLNDGGPLSWPEVACSSAASCVAVDGAATKVYYWGGAAWDPPQPATWEVASAGPLVCSPERCYAFPDDTADADHFGTGDSDVYWSDQSNDGQWNGPKPLDTAGTIQSATCGSYSPIYPPFVTECIALFSHGVLFGESGYAWQRLAGPAGGVVLTGVSCIGEDGCMAVDRAGQVYQRTKGRWRALGGRVAGGVAQFSCSSEYFCALLTDDGHLMEWEGNGWSPLPTRVPRPDESGFAFAPFPKPVLACDPGGGLCLAVGGGHYAVTKG